ncbi:uncharacterized protein [Eurosta solidaginis]|uniref:uncharacterized protein n=1 Tax=Eurosta solidaginis TaxID=178769 RepID=UPI003530DE75
MNFTSKIYCFCSFAALTALHMSSKVSSQSPCTYTALIGGNHELPIDAVTGKSVEYVDYGTNTNGICLQRAKCNKRFETEVRKCSDLRITCENRKLFEGDFPACCVKC